MLKESGQFPAQDIPNDAEQLTMRDLTVGYDRIPLIKNINLGVRPGEILTLIGPNGSGKSTILKTITKQLKTIGGSVFLGKESMRELTDSEISRHLSMVMTERIHTELLSGRDVVATGRYPYTGRLGILSQQDWKKVDEAIALVHAGEVQQQDFRRISDGQRQRLMLARADGCKNVQFKSHIRLPIWIWDLNWTFLQPSACWHGRKTWQLSCHCTNWIWHRKFRTPLRV